MSNHEVRRSTPNHRRPGRAAQITAAALTAGAVLAGYDAIAHVTPATANKLTASSNFVSPKGGYDAVISPDKFISNQELAQQQADRLQTVVNNTIHNPSDRVTTVPLLNGLIEQQSISDPSEGYIPSYKDAYLLTTVGAPLDGQGKFLKGAWIGVGGNLANGEIRITAVPYDSKTMRFVPNDPSSPVIVAGVYAAAVKGGPGFDEYAAIGYDPTGSSMLQNNDGTPIYPGMSLGMK